MKKIPTIDRAIGESLSDAPAGSDDEFGCRLHTLEQLTESVSYFKTMIKRE